MAGEMAHWGKLEEKEQGQHEERKEQEY